MAASNIKVDFFTIPIELAWDKIIHLHEQTSSMPDGSISDIQTTYINAVISVITSLPFVDRQQADPWSSFFNKVKDRNSLEGLEIIFYSMLSDLLDSGDQNAIQQAISLLDPGFKPSRPGGNFFNYIFVDADQAQISLLSEAGITQLFDQGAQNSFADRGEFVARINNLAEETLNSKIKASFDGTNIVFEKTDSGSQFGARVLALEASSPKDQMIKYGEAVGAVVALAGAVMAVVGAPGALVVIAIGAEMAAIPAVVDSMTSGDQNPASPNTAPVTQDGTTTSQSQDVPAEDNAEPEGPETEGPSTEGPPTEGPEQEGPEQEGPEQEGPEQEGPEQEGPEQEGPEQEGPEHEGPEQEGPEHEGPEHEGPEHEGPEHEGPEHEGPEHEGGGHEGA